MGKQGGQGETAMYGRKNISKNISKNIRK